MKEIITRDTEGIVSYETVQGWVGRDRKFYGKNKDLAIFANITHKKCECGLLIEKHRVKCNDCYSKSETQRYMSLDFKEYDGVTPLFIYHDDTFFADKEDLLWYLESNEEIEKEDLKLVLARKQKLRTIPSEFLTEMLPEDMLLEEYSPEISSALNQLNKLIEANETDIWVPTNIRTKV